MTHPFKYIKPYPATISFEEEQELILAIKNGEDSPVKRLGSLTWNIFRRKLKKINFFIDSHEVNDVFIDTYTKLRDNLFAGKYTYRPGKGIVAYFLYLGKFEVLKYKNKHKKGHSGSSTQEQAPSPFPPAIENHPFNQVKDRFQRKRLSKAMEKISIKCQRILKKFYYEDFKLDEIAPIVELSPGSMKKTKERCEIKLLKAYYKIFDLHIMHDFHEVH